MKIQVDSIIAYLEGQLDEAEQLGRDVRERLHQQLDQIDGRQDGLIGDQPPQGVFKVIDRFVQDGDSPLGKLWADPAKNFDARLSIRGIMQNCEFKRVHSLPIKVYRVADKDGSNQARTSPEDIINWVVYANWVMRKSDIPLEVSFNPTTDWAEIKDTDLNHLDAVGERGDKKAADISWRHPEDLVVFLPWGTQSHTNANAMYAKSRVDGRQGLVDYIQLPSQYGASEWSGEYLFIHEIGHFLGLKHTFPRGGMNTYESAAAYLKEHGHLDGDGLADTPWDPGEGFTSYHYHTHWRLFPSYCDSEYEGYRINGHLIKPDARNVMSYYSACNPDYFSPQQREIMLESIKELKRGKEVISLKDSASNPSCSADGQALAIIEEDASKDDMYRALDVLMFGQGGHTRRGQAIRGASYDETVEQLVRIQRVDPSVSQSIAQYIRDRAHLLHSRSREALMESLIEAKAPLDIVEKPFREAALKSLNYRPFSADSGIRDLKIHHASGFHVGMATIFSQRFATAEPETGSGGQLMGTYRLRNTGELLAQVDMLRYGSFADGLSTTQLNMVLGLNFYLFEDLVGDIGDFEIFTGFRAGVWHRPDENITGIKFSSLLIPTVYGFQARLGENLYLNVNASLLADVLPAQNGHEQEEGLDFYSTAGVQYHYQ